MSALAALPPVHSTLDWQSLCAFRLHFSNHRPLQSFPSKWMGGPNRSVATPHNRDRAASAAGVMGIEIPAAGANTWSGPRLVEVAPAHSAMFALMGILWC